ncbi:Tctex-type 1 light chain of dynein [Chloropicon roscoffensis]|uniref:Tctex-type 1 light chain of dynein n=1 Tax=Chloropicon roscoffensis TaxID=1461544 RepID=A0AAX4PH63_9CHLO
MEDTNNEEISFVGDEVSNIIKESIEIVLQNQQYHQKKVNQWSSLVVENAMKRLTAMNTPFKYIATCVIMQKNGAGLHTGASCYWDNSTDGSRTVRWESKHLYCITTVFGLAL